MPLTAKMVLEEVQRLLPDRSHWTKGDFARDKWGHPVKSSDPKAARFCLLGATYRAVENLDGPVGFGHYERNRAQTEALEALDNCAHAISGTMSRFDGVATFNDTLAKGFKDIRAVIDCAVGKVKG